MTYTVIKGNTVREFHPFIDTLGDEFTRNISDVYRRWVAHLPCASERSYWFHIKMALNFFAEEGKLGHFRQVVCQEIFVDSSAEFMVWQNALSCFREYVSQLKLANVSKSNIIHSVRLFFCDYCPNEGVVPHDLTLNGWKVDIELGKGATALDQQTLRVLGQSEDDLIKLIACLDDSDVDLDDDFIQLLKESADQVANVNTVINRVDLAVKLLEARISSLKITSATIYIEYINATKKTEQWLKEGDLIQRAKRLDAMFSGYSNIKFRLKGIEYKNLLKTKRIEVIITWIKLFCGGRYPQYTDQRYSSFNALIKREKLSRDEIEWYLGKSRSAMTAGYVFILFETAGNSESIWNLTTNDIMSSDGYKNTYRLSWIKRRSNGHESMSMDFKVRKLPLEVSTLTVKDVFEHQMECRKDHLIDVRAKDENKLFLSLFKNYTKINVNGVRAYKPSHPSSGFLLNQFSTLCELASDGKWRTTPKAIRGSLLLLIGIMSRDATAVAELGQHKSLQMAKRYTYHLPEVLRRDQNIRDFLDWFEALLTVDIKGFAKKLGIDKSLYEDRVKKARIIRNAEIAAAVNQQFGGIHCSDPLAGVQAVTNVGEVCNKIQNCPTCEKRRGMFILSQSNLTNVMHWHEVLEKAKSKQRNKQFEPWQLWYIFTSMILDRFSQSPEHAALFRLAEKNKQTEINPYLDVIPLMDVTS